MAVIKDAKRHRKGKSGTSKYGRNKAKCERYRARGQRERNKARRAERLRRHLERCAARRAGG